MFAAYAARMPCFCTGWHNSAGTGPISAIVDQNHFAGDKNSGECVCCGAVVCVVVLCVCVCCGAVMCVFVCGVVYGVVVCVVVVLWCVWYVCHILSTQRKIVEKAQTIEVEELEKLLQEETQSLHEEHQRKIERLRM